MSATSSTPELPRSPLRVARPWLLGLAALIVGIGISVALAADLLPMTTAEFRDLGLLVAGTSVVSLVIGWLLLVALDRALQPSIALRAFLGASVGTLAAFGNVLAVSALMFVNTEHDLRLLVVLLAAGGGITMCFSMLVARSTGSRLQALTGAVQRLAGHDYTPGLAPHGGGREVTRLARDIESLRVELSGVEARRAAMDREQRELTTAISHDLRTPVANVRAIVDALEDGVVAGEDEVREYYGRIRHEAKRLSAMIDDLLELARFDAGAATLDLHPVPLQDIVGEVVEAMRPLAERAGVRLSLSVLGDPAPLSLDPLLIERAVSNLVKNAVEHTQSGGQVEASVGTADGATHVTVTDTGAGIAPEHLERVWERFYRAEAARTRLGESGGGAGLGLAIVRRIAEAHAGGVAVSSSVGHGSAFTLSLPTTSR